VSDYGLDDRGIEVRSPTEADFSSSPASRPALGPTQPPVQWVPGGTGGSFPGGKARPGRDADHSPPSSAEVKNEELYVLSPHVPPWRAAGQLYFFTLPLWVPPYLVLNTDSLYLSTRFMSTLQNHADRLVIGVH
jgi:hypothetical protein